MLYFFCTEKERPYQFNTFLVRLRDNSLSSLWSEVYILYTLISGVSYSWLSALFSAGGFKVVSAKSPKQANVQTVRGDSQQHQEESPPSSVYSCPREGCIRVFQRASTLERHLSLEACSMSPERLAKQIDR